MDTGELCHGYKSGRNFQVLATSWVMLDLLSMLCSAAGLRAESLAVK